MTRLCGVVFSASLLASTGDALQAQSAAGLAGQPGRGITAVTRRTLMVTPGQQANAFFAAGGVNVAAPTAGALPAAAPVAPAVVSNSPGLQRPDVQGALRQLAAGGNAQARQLLQKPAVGATTATAGASQ